MPKFTKTTEEKYWEMLGVLPPAIMTGYGFLVGEPMDHNAQGRPRFSCFMEYRGEFFESVAPMTIAEFKAIKSEDLQ